MGNKHEIMVNSIGMKLVLVKAGKFIMGSSIEEYGRDSDEGPQHEVTLTKDFFIGVCQVTQEQYQKVMGENFSKFKCPENPVEMVNKYEAELFCERLSQAEGLNYKLPTEAQWEYACRAGSDSLYCSGDDLKKVREYAWFADNSGNKPHPVGLRKANAWGINDMHGNVWEWCQDKWDQNGYCSEDSIDPVGTLGYTDVIRGGCFHCKLRALRSAKRFGYYAGGRFYSIGLRIVYECVYD
ncbi:MAG: formylglycine-generating enzyme family protein [Planctomycetota bacterium]